MSARQASLEDYSTDHADLDDLSDAEQAVYQSVHLGDYTPTAYAHDTDRDPSTVRTLLYRAHQKLDGETDE